MGCALSQDKASGDESVNINVRAAFIHVLGDLVQSIGVFSAAIIIHLHVCVFYIYLANICILCMICHCIVSDDFSEGADILFRVLNPHYFRKSKRENRPAIRFLGIRNILKKILVIFVWICFLVFTIALVYNIY